MKTLLHRDMIEAARLTQAGQLAEATALIQRLLGGGLASDTAADHPAGARQVPPIELTAENITRRSRERTRSTESNTDGRNCAGRQSSRPSLRSTVGHLERLRTMLRQGEGLATHSFGPAPPLPDGARFVSAKFSGPAGGRDYKLYIPSGYRNEPVPLIVMLHGCTQSADDFATGTGMNALAEKHGFLVLYPVQAQSANSSRCWNWFKPTDQRRDAGEPSLIAGMTKKVAREMAVDARRIYVAGLSAGGAAAAIMATAYPDLFAAVGVHSGLPFGAASDLPSALSAMRQGSVALHKPTATQRIPAIVFHGDQDKIVHPHNGVQIIKQFQPAERGELRAMTVKGHADGGLSYSRTCHLDSEERALLEKWTIHGSGHAWSGGNVAGTYTDPRGPDASREMVRFFLQHSHPLPAE